MPDYTQYYIRVKFIISNKAETATDKVNAFLNELDAYDVISITPLIVPIGAIERKGYLVGAMIEYVETKEEAHLYDKGIDFGAGMDCQSS